MVVHKVKTGDTSQELNIYSATTCMMSEFIPQHKPDDTDRGETMSAVLNCIFLIIDLLKYVKEQYVRRVVEMLHWQNFDKEAIRINLKNLDFMQ